MLFQNYHYRPLVSYAAASPHILTTGKSSSNKLRTKESVVVKAYWMKEYTAIMLKKSISRRSSPFLPDYKPGKGISYRMFSSLGG